MKNTRRNKIMSAAIWLIVLASGTGLFVSAQMPTPTPLTKEEKLNIAKKNFEEGIALFDEQTIDSYRVAYEKFRQASEIYQEIGDTSENAGVSLFGMGLISDRLGEKSTALKLFDQALKFFRDNKYKNWEATTLNNIGLVYSSLGEKQRALEYFNQALPVRRQVGDKSGEAATLNNIGSIYDSLGEQQKALDYYNQAVSLNKQVGNKRSQATTISNLGGVYSELGDNQKALEFYNLALVLYREVEDKIAEATILNNIGSIYDILGENQKALEYYNYSLIIYRTIAHKFGEARTLNNLGRLYHKQGMNESALEYFKIALSIFERLGDKSNQAISLFNLGLVFEKLGDNQKAKFYYDKAVALNVIVQSPKTKIDENKNANGKNNTKELNENSLAYKEIQKSRKIYLQTLNISKSEHSQSTEAKTLSELMFLEWALNNSRMSIFYGKQAINIFHELRNKFRNEELQIQNTILRSLKETYYKLTDILIAEGRVAEAEQVLGMLKEEELYEYLRRDDKAAKDLKATIKLTPTEEEAFRRYEEIADQITRIGREFGELEKESKKFPVGKFPRQAELDKLDAQLADARKVFNKFLEELDARFRNKETKAKDARVAQISGTKALLDGLNQPRTVIVSTIAGEDRLNLIVTTSKINRAHTVDIKAAELNKLVVEFRDAVKNPLVDSRPLGKKLYDVLFPADLQKDLAGVDADTIVWSLDGTLRYAPISALWDGQKYLVERYSNAILTLASRDKIDKTQAARTNWTALGLGVSEKFENFDALKAVPQELCRVVQDERKKADCLKLTDGKSGVFGGTNLSDGEFTFENLRLNLGRFPVVHIASHFSLNAGTESDSYLLLGGGKTSDERKLSISAVREKLDTKFVGTELLVLSACNTAMSSGENSSGGEIEGFGALAQEQGAKTVLASLWSVADDSTRDLMTEFYEQLKHNPNLGKAEALRKSQIALLNGKYKPGETPLWRGTAVFNPGETKQPAFKTDKNAPFAHPFYWSPFILFGNWR